MISNSIGNILKVVHATGCNLETAEAALRNSNEWSNVYKYARENS